MSNMVNNNSPTPYDGVSSDSESSTIDSWWEAPRMDNMVDVLTFCCKVFVIFGGVIPYVPQYLKIKNSNSIDGFSTYVCLTLLLANILRIAFWFGRHFELPLLIQSFVMITGMLAMMELCVRVRNRNSSCIISPMGVARLASSNRKRSSLIGKLMLRYKQGFQRHDTRVEESYHFSNSESNNNVDDEQKSATLIDANIENDECTPFCPVDLVLPSSASSSSSSQYIRNSESSYQQRPQQEVIDSLSICSVNDSLYSNSAANENQQKQLSQELYTHNFWNWDDLFSYFKFLSLFTFILSIITYLLIDCYLYIEAIGFIALFIESMLGMPQLLRNYHKKSTRGMSVAMVVMWALGDLLKTIYFILSHDPAQFIICGSIQETVDILILLQVFLYRKSNITYSKLVPKTT